MRRRRTLGLLATAVFAPHLAQAQQSAKPPTVGFLHPGVRALGSPTITALRRDMGAAGLIDGQTVKIEERWGGGDPGNLPAFAKELVALDPAVIVAVSRSAIDAVRSQSMTVPIVCSDLESDPVAIGYATTLSKPGGNVTGQFLDAPSICGKWLQQLGALVPNLRKLGVLWDAGIGPYQRDALLSAAKASSLEARVIEFRDAGSIDSVMDAGLTPDIQALVLLGSPLINQFGGRIAAVTTRHHLPGISPFRTFPDGGGLMSYGVDLSEIYRRLVPFVVKVLRGTKAGDIPIEQPVKFELVVNVKAAKVLGLTVPANFVASADEVIE
jgi:putative ABC transport system substrate-binding protein